MYRNLSVPYHRIQNFSELMNYETTPLDKSLYGSACSTNYYYFGKLSMPQKGEISPVRSGDGDSRRDNFSNLSNFKVRMINNSSAMADGSASKENS